MKKTNKIIISIITLTILTVVVFAIKGGDKANGNITNGSENTITATGKIGLNIGDTAPDFIISTIDKQTLSLASFRNKKALVITTIASWCPTCILEAEQFAPVYPQFKDSVEFLSVSIDPTDDRVKLEAFRVNNNTPWFYTEPKLPGVRDMILAYRFDRFEITYIIDKDGVIRFKDRSVTPTKVLQEELGKIAGQMAKKELGEYYENQGQKHIDEGETHPPYNSNPPTSGWHYRQPADWGIYTAELPDEQVIHNLEHGGIWISYRHDITEDQRKVLTEIASKYTSKVILTPRANNDEPIAVAAWQRLMKFKTPLSKDQQELIISFIEQYKNRGPEFISD